MLRWLSRLRSSKADSFYERGSALYAAGDARGAEENFRSALELQPRHVAAQVNLALALLAQGFAVPAENACRRALALAPGDAAALVALGCSLERRGRLDEAMAAWRAALESDDACVPALCNLSAAHLRQGAPEAARQAAQRAVAAAPALAEAHVRLGKALLECREPAQAAASFHEAARLDPGAAAPCNALGYALDVQGRSDEALQCYERALAIDPRDAQAHVNRAAILLLRERYAEGWDEYEWRVRAPENAALHARVPQPRWDGTPLLGRSILVYAEQGLGDQILYASCLPEVLAQAGDCVVECEPRLEALFRRAFPKARVNADASGMDLAISAASLPRLLRRSARAFPRTAYLAAAPQRVAAWRERLRALGPGRKVGVSWRGGVAQTGRAARSLDLQALLPLLREESCRFVNLQYGESQAELADLRSRHGVHIETWPEAIEDYDETAALVHALDLTVSVCTSLVHLAGALGRPVWVLAPVRPEFRYGLRGETMPWYASARMFRQLAYGDWAPVVQAVVAALREERHDG